MHTADHVKVLKGYSASQRVPSCVVGEAALSSALSGASISEQYPASTQAQEWHPEQCILPFASCWPIYAYTEHVCHHVLITGQSFLF